MFPMLTLVLDNGIFKGTFNTMILVVVIPSSSRKLFSYTSTTKTKAADYIIPYYDLCCLIKKAFSIQVAVATLLTKKKQL
jgi:hypothetical protein